MIIQKTPTAMARQSEIYSTIRSLYLSGTPLFTRAQLTDVRNQLQALDGKAGKILITSVPGEIVEFIVHEIGHVITLRRGREQVMGKPVIAYRTIQDLTADHERTLLFTPSTSSCSLHIWQESIFRGIVPDENDKFPQPEPPEGLPEATVRDSFKNTLHDWQSSKSCKDLFRSLLFVDLSAVKQIVGFACGSLKYGLGDWPQPTYQHILLINLCAHLLERQTPDNAFDIPIYVQDPAYTSLDRSILLEHKIEILDDPDGFLAVDDSTFVLSFAPNVAVKQVITEIAKPAAIIWDRGREDRLIGGVLCTDPGSERVRDMLEKEYVKVECLWDERISRSSEMYLRRLVGS